MLDLFAGCGGLSYGFQKAGCSIEGFVESWKPAITTFLHNHPKALHLGSDITKVSDAALLTWKGKVDIIVGGPPCQGFSMCGKRDPHDKRNQLYKEFIRCVAFINPKVVVMENVAGMLSMEDKDGEKILLKIIDDLIQMDYFVSYRKLNAAEFGIPQNRERIFIIAVKLSLFPIPTFEKKTTMEAIQDLPEHEHWINGHILFDTTPETLEKIKKLKSGEKLYSTFNFGRQRLRPDKPSRTVPTNPIFIHPEYDRFLTPREMARLQSFPDDFTFCGTKTDMATMIGNAVPPRLSQKIASTICESGIL